MNQEKLSQIIKDHTNWLRTRGLNNPIGKRAMFSGSELTRANVENLNLANAHLGGANLEGAFLSKANFSEAYFSGANLRGAHLGGANFSRAYFGGASLINANLGGANLEGADLRWANITNTALEGASLRGAKLPAPSMVLLASWGELSPNLTKKAMSYDAFFHEDPEAFSAWANNGPCPYENVSYNRACNFYEEMDLWDPTIPCPRGFDLMVEIIREKCRDSDWH